MNFSLVCLLAVIVTVPFGAAFLLAPESVGAQYGISGWNPSTLVVARLFGIALLYSGAAALAVRHTRDTRVQKGISTGFAVASILATSASIHAVTSGAVNAMGWSTVAIYGVFTLAWASVAFRKPS